MKRVFTFLPQHFRKLWVAYLVLALSLLPTAVVYYRVKANVRQRDLTRFDRLVNDERAAIQERIPHYVDEMMGVRGLFSANQTVTPDQWRRYLASLEIQTTYPGIRTLGYLEKVNAADKKAFVARQRMRGRPFEGIQPEGDRDVYFPVVFEDKFEPGLLPRVGGDPFADAERRPFILLAGDTGRAIATGKVSLRAEGTGNLNAAGFVIYLPVYRAGLPTATVEERQAALQGFIFGNFESETLLKSIFNSQPNVSMDCEVFDGVELNEAHLLYNSDLGLNSAAGRSHEIFEKVTMPVLNRTWTLHFSSLPSFESDSQLNLPTIALACWLTLSFLLFGITCAEVNARSGAEQITAELRKSETALAAEKERLAVTLYSIGDGVITTDINGCVLSVNKVAGQLTGWANNEALGKPLTSFFKLVAEDTREPIVNPLETALQTGEICGLAQPALLVAKDGAERVISDSAAPIRNREGGIIGAVVVFRDVTARQKTEAEVLKERKLESVGLLAGGIAHDFNNILQGILGNLSLARMSMQSPEKILDRLAAMEKSALRAKDLTQQLVMFARGGAPIRKRVQLNDSIKDAAQLALHGTNIHCEFYLDTDLWSTEVDEGQFRQVINNTVLNAMLAMPEGGKIEVRSENIEFTAGALPPLTPGRYIAVSIRDFGVGIRPEHLPRIFDPYFTTRKHARGLGLASAYSVIRKHDGQISVDTQVGQGSTFHIYLPATVKAIEIPLPEGDQKRFFGRGRVLVMDDEADILMLVREMLELTGYEVEVATDGAEALKRYMAAKNAHNPFSVVIMDLTVPQGMGGKEAIHRLKELDPHARAIVSSGYSYDPVMASFREFGFSGVIPKPYIMEDLSRVVEEVMAMHGAPVATAT